MMKKDLILSYALLLMLTVSSALISGLSMVPAIVGSLLMILSGFKFIIVCFQFMEIKKAHAFWKTGLVFTLGLLIAIIIVLK